jgi:hypothetical protein
VGQAGSGTGVARGLVLDAGALIALERGDPKVTAVLHGSLSAAAQVVIPATALAQVWREGPRSASLARLVAASEVDPLDEKRAKQVGARLGFRSASDVSDAHVVCCASQYGAAVATSDMDDIRALAMPDERLALIVV